MKPELVNLAAELERLRDDIQNTDADDFEDMQYDFIGRLQWVIDELMTHYIPAPEKGAEDG